MGGKRYYNFKSGNVALFALDSNYMDPEQFELVEGTTPGIAIIVEDLFFPSSLIYECKVPRAGPGLT